MEIFIKHGFFDGQYTCWQRISCWIIVSYKSSQISPPVLSFTIFPTFFFVSRWDFLLIWGQIFMKSEPCWCWAEFSPLLMWVKFSPRLQFNTCLCQKEKSGRTVGGEVTHAFRGKYLPKIDLASVSVFILLSIMISWKMGIPHPCTFNNHLYLCFSKEKYVNTLLSLKMTKDLSNFLFVQYCYGNTV